MTDSQRPAAFRFCPRCGERLSILDRGGAPRPTCENCGYVQYLNPVVGVAVVVRDEQKRVLLGRRASGGYEGLWCIPCGYVEWDEEIRDAGMRELKEETGLIARAGAIIAVHSNFHNEALHTVGVWFEGIVTGGALQPVDGELSEVAYFNPAEPPELAFPTDLLVLNQLAEES